MPMTIDEFRKIYNTRSYELTGSAPDPKQIDEEYRDYLALVEFAGVDGNLNFERDGNNCVTWDFVPLHPEQAS